MGVRRGSLLVHVYLAVQTAVGKVPGCVASVE
jgi:hypothetical protein